MIEFQTIPDRVFLAIVEEALGWCRDMLFPYRTDYRPTAEQLSDADENYQHLYPELAEFFTRQQLLDVVDALISALHDPNSLYRVTDFHWLVMYYCLEMVCDLHNDGALGSDDAIGSYIIDKIDFNYLVDTFFFDTDFLFGNELFIAQEHGRGVPDVSAQARKIAAKLKPEPADLTLTLIDQSESWAESQDALPSLPPAGYIGPYPMRRAGQSEAT